MAYKVGTVTAIAQSACIFLFSLFGGCSSSDAGQTASAAVPTTTSSGVPADAAPTADAPTAAAPTAQTNTAATSSLVTNFTGGDACLALTMPSTEVLFDSSKKVFAHYFFPFPKSLDNVAPSGDYYNDQYLNRHGESNKWLNQGGFLRQRPLGANPSSNVEWQRLNMEAEIRAAIARGITGFTFDVMSADDAIGSDSPLQQLLAAAQAVDSRFKIMVMPDLTALGSDSNAVVQIIASVAGNPAAYRLSDGRLVASAFDASLNSASWWQSVLNQLSAKGIKVAFVPTFLGWHDYAAAFAPFSYGFGDWGTATASSAGHMQPDAGTAHGTYGKIFMMPVGPQQYRPKDFTYWEAGNSAAFRNAWVGSIQGHADWVQLVTWNDFSESSQMTPYTEANLRRDIGTGYYDLNGYYATWFVTGKEPVITHDVLYYFYRREPSNAAAPAQSRLAKSVTGAVENDIELLAFLTAPGVLKITIGGKTYTQNASAGIASFKIPSQLGNPVFTLSRNGADVFSFKGGVYIYGVSGRPSGVQDLTYWSGSAAKTGICSH